MALNKIQKITNKQISEKGVQALADRPNLTGQYGASGLSATQLKAWFDKLATFLAEKVNEIATVISSDEAANYIRVCLDEYGVESFGDLVTAFTDGNFAAKILQVLPSAGSNEKQALQTVINNVAKQLADIKEQKLDKITSTSNFKRAYTVAANGDQGTVPISETPLPSTLPLYSANMQLSSSTPTQSLHTVNKEFLEKENKKLGAIISSSINRSTHVITLSLRNSEGTTLSTTSVDLPLESLFINGYYADGVLTLNLGNEQGGINDRLIHISISDLVAGLVNESEYETERSRIWEEIYSNKSTTEYLDYVLRTRDYLSDYHLISEHEERIEGNEKAIKNLFLIAKENALYTMLEVEQAYTARETANGEEIVDGQYTAVTEIKGSTKRCENLIPFPYVDGMYKEANGGTFTAREDGSVVVNGTFTAQTVFILSNALPLKGTFSLSGNPVSDMSGLQPKIDGVWDSTVYDNGAGSTFTVENEISVLYIVVTIPNGESSRTLNNVVFKPMLNAGSTALPYQPYFTDLKHPYISGIKSTGRNLLDISKLVGGALVDNGDGTYTITRTSSGRFSKECVFDAPVYFGTIFPYFEIVDITTTDRGVAVHCTLSDGTKRTIGLNEDWQLYGIYDYPVVSFRLYVGVDQADGAYVTFKNAMIIREGVGANAEYEPYTEETYQLPETLELAIGDSLNPQTGELVRQTRTVTLTGEESWISLDTGTHGIEFYIDLVARGGGAASKDGYRNKCCECSHFAGMSREDLWVNETDACVSAHDNYLRFKHPTYIITDGDYTAWTDYLKEQYANGTPVTIEYKLATAESTETIENVPKSYTAYKHGNEGVVQGETDNSKYGATPTITNKYFKLTEV